MTTKTIKLDDMVVTYEDTREIRDLVFERVMEYYLKHESFHGECICQSDDPIIDAPYVLADIADDILKFNVTCTD